MSAEEANQLIEYLAKINYRAPFETSGSSNRLRGGGVIELNRMTVIEAKLDALMNKLGNQERRMHSSMKCEQWKETSRRVSLMRDLLLRVPIRWRRLSLWVENKATISSPTTTFQPTTHRH